MLMTLSSFSVCVDYGQDLSDYKVDICLPVAADMVPPGKVCEWPAPDARRLLASMARTLHAGH
jgi:hypothetical protein